MIFHLRGRMRTAAVLDGFRQGIGPGPGPNPQPTAAARRVQPALPANPGKGRPPRRRRWTLALVVLSTFFLAGCWDLEEIDSRTPILGISFDFGPRGGWQMLATIPDPRALVPAGGTVIGPQPQEPSFIVLETSGTSAAEAVNNLRDITSRELFFGQVMVIGVSDRMARRGLGPLLEFLMNNTELPRAAWFVVTAGPPARVLGIKPPQQTFPEFYLDNVFRARSKAAASLGLPYWRLWLMSLRQGQDALVPLVESGPQQQMRLARAAAFRGDRMMGVLSPEETRLVALLRGARHVMWEVQGSDGRRFAFRPTQVRTTVEPLATSPGEPPRFRFQVRMHMVLDEAEKLHPTDWPQIEEAAQRDLTASIQRLLRKLQRWQSDIWGFGERLRVSDPQAFAAQPWPQQWQKARVEVAVRVWMVRGGALH